MKILLLIFGAIFLIGGFGVFGDGFSLVFVLIGAFMIGLYVLFAKEKAAKNTEKKDIVANHASEQSHKAETRNAPANVAECQSPEEKTATKSFPESVDGEKIAYHYEHVNLYVPDNVSWELDSITPGEDVLFRQEPENTYDSKAVSVFTKNNTKLGYLYKGTIKDMVNDFMQDALPVLSCVDSVGDDGTITLFIAFYRSRKKSINAKVYKLAANRNQAMQDNILSCNPGDGITISYDDDKGKYYAEHAKYWWSTPQIIGYFPAAANDFLEDSSAIFIDRVEEDDNGKLIVYVAVEP